MNEPISTFSQASEDLPWQQSGTGIEPLASVTTNHTPKPSSRSTGRKSRATRTSGKYEATYTQESLFSPADSPASHSVLPGSNEARTTTVISGRKCAESYARQGQLGSLVRMLLESSTWHSTRCVLIWKRKVTKSNRSLFQLAPSMRHTEETGYGLLPTSTACDHKSRGPNSKQVGLDNYWKLNNPNRPLWPTPNQSDYKGAGVSGKPRDRLDYAVERGETKNSVMWPTPSANDDAAGTPKGNMQKMLGNHPDIRGTTPEEWQRGSLNPTWVAWLMGYPTEWLNCVDSEMPSSRKSRRKSSETSTS